MKTKIKEVQDYFRNKLRAGEFRITCRGSHSIDLKIDEEYEFTLWTFNRISRLEIWKMQYNFIHFDLSEDDKQEIWQHLEVDKNKNEAIKKQINELKKQLI